MRQDTFVTREMITRRHLPHWFVPGAFHFVTYRLTGTIPLQVLENMKAKKQAALKEKPPAGVEPAAFRERIHKQFFAEYDRYLDNNRTIQWLAEPRVAAIIRENLYHHRGTKYELLSYCIMPNHVHVLLRPIVEDPADGAAGQAGLPVLREDELAEEETPDDLSALARIMHSLKSYTASQANKILGRSGTFWQEESYDHWVRDAEELERIVEYIAANPVKAGLVGEAHQWFFCSAHDRFLQDGTRAAWLLP
jgi:putative DNA methylase